MADNANLVGKEINHGLDNILIKALFVAEKNSSAENARRVYDKMLMSGMNNRSALGKLGILQKPLDVYVAGAQSQKLICLPLLLVLSHILP